MFGKNLLPFLLLFISALNLAQANPECTPADSSTSGNDFERYTNIIKKDCEGAKKNEKKNFQTCKEGATFSYDTERIIKKCKACSSASEENLPFLCKYVYKAENEGKKIFDCVLAEIKKEVTAKGQSLESAINTSGDIITACCDKEYHNSDCK